nr:1-acyl-sn-glycerol-3-phosphate acyltransferase [Anaeroplasmataceae bacterium]
GLHLYKDWYFIFLLIGMIRVFYGICFLIYILFLFFWSLFLSKKKIIKQPSRIANFIIKETCKKIIFFSNTKLHLQGFEKMPEQPCLFVSNHTSMFDAIAMLAILKKSVCCVTKMENERIPICGPFIHHAGYISLDRSNAFHAVKSIQKAAEYIETNTASIYICPEGTRSKTGEMLPFHPGSFKIATKTEADIVLISISGANQVKKNFPFRRSHIYITLVDVLSHEAYHDKKTVEIADIAYEIIKNDLKEK